MLRHAWTGALLMLLASPLPGTYVTDRLTIGLFEDPAQTDRPIRVLSAGTPVESLQRRGTYTQVRLGDNQTGWLEARYLTEDKPLKVRLVEEQARVGQTWKQIQALERQLADRDRLIEELANPPGQPGRLVAVKAPEPETPPASSASTSDELGSWLLAGAGTALGFLGGLGLGLFRAHG